MYEYTPEQQDDDPGFEPTPHRQPSLTGRLCWLMIVLTFLSGIMCNVVVIVYLFDHLIRGIRQ